MEERNQHVTVLTETIDALQSTSGQSTDRIAQELERQAQNNEQGGGEDGQVNINFVDTEVAEERDFVAGPNNGGIVSAAT